MSIRSVKRNSNNRKSPKRNRSPKRNKSIIINYRVNNQISINFDRICNLSLEHFLYSNKDLKTCLEYNANTKDSLLNRAQQENNKELVYELMKQRKKFSIIYFPYIFHYLKIKLTNGITLKYLLFGEKHQSQNLHSALLKKFKSNDYVTFLDLLEYLLRRDKKKCIDFYFEIFLNRSYKQVGGSQRPGIKTHMDSLRNYAKRIDGVYKNVRVQRFDLRKKTYEQINLLFWKFMRNHKEIFSNSRFKHLFLNYILIIDENETLLFSELSKLIDKTPDSPNKGLILNQLRRVKEKLKNQYMKFLKTKLIFIHGIDIRELLYRYFDEKLKRELNSFQSWITDFYVILRLLKLFDVKKINRGPKYCRRGRNVYTKSGIFYAGAAHVTNIVEILKIIYGDHIEVFKIGDVKYTNNYINFNKNSVNKLGFNDFYEIIDDFIKRS